MDEKLKFEDALNKAIHYLEIASAMKLGPRRVRAPLQREIDALRVFIERYRARDWEHLRRRPLSKERLAQLQEAGAKGGRSQSPDKLKTSPNNLPSIRKARDKGTNATCAGTPQTGGNQPPARLDIIDLERRIGSLEFAVTQGHKFLATPDPHATPEGLAHFKNGLLKDERALESAKSELQRLLARHRADSASNGSPP